MKFNSYQDRLLLLGLVTVFASYKGGDWLHYFAAVFLMEFLVETALALWNVLSEEKSPGG